MASACMFKQPLHRVFSTMLFLRNFERFNNLHAYHGRVGGNQLPPVNLLLPRITGRNIRPNVINFTNWPPLRLRWAHYFRMRDHGSSLFSAVKNLHLSGLHPFLLPIRVTKTQQARICTSSAKHYIYGSGATGWRRILGCTTYRLVALSKIWSWIIAWNCFSVVVLTTVAMRCLGANSPEPRRRAVPGWNVSAAHSRHVGAARSRPAAIHV